MKKKSADDTDDAGDQRILTNFHDALTHMWSIEARVGWLNDFAEDDLSHPVALDWARWCVRAFALAPVGETAMYLIELIQSKPDRMLALLGADDEMPEATPGELAALQLAVKQVLRFLRSPIEESADFALPVPISYKLHRRQKLSTIAVPTGDTQSRFFGSLLWTLREATKLEPCKAPKCERIFVPTRKSQLYCSTRCQNRATGERHRKKLRKSSRPR